MRWKDKSPCWNLKRERLSGLIRLVENLMKGERNMNFEAFDKKEYEARRDAYAEEARERWGGILRLTGNLSAGLPLTRMGTGRKFRKRWRGFSSGLRTAWTRAEPVGRGKGPAGELQAYLTRRFYLCTPEILSGLGEMYAADQRFRAYFRQNLAPGWRTMWRRR